MYANKNWKVITGIMVTTKEHLRWYGMGGLGSGLTYNSGKSYLTITVLNNNRNWRKAVIRHYCKPVWIYLTFVSTKPASTIHFYWTEFSECSFSFVVSVLKYVYEYSETAVFNWDYPIEVSQRLSRGTGFELRHRVAKSDVRENACALSSPSPTDNFKSPLT